MARYTDANCKLCRREGQKLFLKGERCYSTKCAIEKRNYAPGQHGQSRKKHVRLWYSVKRKAEGKEILRCAGNSVQKLIRQGCEESRARQVKTS